MKKRREEKRRERGGEREREGKALISNTERRKEIRR